MDRLEAAARHYRTIVTQDLLERSRIDRYIEFPVRELITRLERYVVPAVDELWTRPRFRELAAWPQRKLRAGCGTAERQLVDEADGALVLAAKALLKLASPVLIARALTEQNPPRQTVTGETIMIGETTEVVDRQYGTLDVPALLREQTQAVATRSWSDLVCPEDYLDPVGGMMRRETPRNSADQAVTDGEFVVSLNPDLLPVGDFITASLMKRIDTHRQSLAGFRQLVYQAQRSTHRSYDGKVRAEQESWSALTDTVRQLQGTCLNGSQFHLRDAAIVLTQAYLSFSSMADAAWLGFPQDFVNHQRGLVRHNVESMRNLQTVERIALAVGELQRLYRDLPEGVSTVDEAVGHGGLVLQKRPRNVWWKHERLDVDWNQFRKPWEMLWQLAVRSRLHQAVSDRDLYSEPVSNSTIYNRWRRLEQLLPPDLADCVHPATACGRACYQLRLNADQVTVFEK